MNKHELLRRKLLKRYRAMLAECEQLTRDIQSWNDNRTEHPPFDLGRELVMADGLRKTIAALERDEPIDPAWLPQTPVEDD